MRSSTEITKEMIDEFNHALQTMNCSFRLQLETGVNSNQCNIIIANDMFIKSCVINLTDRFYETLEGFFAKYGIKLNYNNTKSTFWNISVTNKNSS